MSTIPAIEPATITAGDTVQWLRSLPDYPASAGWSLHYRLICSAGIIDITSTASGDDHLVSVPAATSAAWVPGNYTVALAAVNGADRFTLTVPYSAIDVLADLAAATTATDTRTRARRILDALNLAIEGRASRSDLEYEVNVGGRAQRLKSMSVDQLLVAQRAYTLIVWRELNPGQLCPQVRLSSRYTHG